MTRFAALLSCCLVLLACCLLPFAVASEPCQSGPQPGQRPGPYAALVATGPQRGQAHCFICETGDKPAVIIFAREMSDPLGNLLVKLDQAVAKQGDGSLHVWVTFLSDNEPALEPKLVEWSRRIGLSNIPIGVFEDIHGPPSYRLNPDADITILVAVKQKIVTNHAFRRGELNEEKANEVVAALPRILSAKP